MAKVIMLPNGDQVADRRQHVILTGPVIALVIFLFSQATGGVWWASWVTAKLEFMTKELSEMKDSIKEANNGRSKLVSQSSTR